MESQPPITAKARVLSLKKALALSLLMLSLGVIAGYAVSTLTGHVPVTVTGPAGPLLITMASVVVDNPASFKLCTISSDGLTATCPSIGITTTSINVFSLTVKNTGTVDLPVTVATASDNPGVATITASPLNPASVKAGSQSIFIFTLSGLTSGMANLSASLTG